MDVHAVLTPGLRAYERGDYVQALVAWEEPWKGLDPSWDAPQKELSLALIRLAGALHHQRQGREDSSRQLYDSARRLLAELPSPVLGVNVEHLRCTCPADPRDALESPPEIQGSRHRVPRHIWLRAALLVVLVVTGFAVLRWTPLAGFLTPDRLIALLTDLREAWWTPVALVGLYVVLCPVGMPASPLMLAGGFVFGALWGGVLNFVGTFLGAGSSFLLGRLLGRDLVVHLAGDRLQRVERVLHRRGFWTLVRVRFLPVPFPVVNYGAALAGVSAPRFMIASGLGLAPAVFIYTWFAAALARATASERGAVVVQMVLAVLAVLLLSFLPAVIRGRARRKRYRRILEERRARNA